ncbi:MAG: hypothetical protein ABWW65_01570 [Thermoprotei archaeon]
MLGDPINRLYFASKIYFSSYGIAWFDLELFLKILRLIYVKKSCSVKELDNLIKESGAKFAKTGREGYYYAKLLRYLGIVSAKRVRGITLITLNSHGARILYSLRNTGFEPSRSKPLLRQLFSNWLPLQVFLYYIHLRGGRIRIEDIVRDLGGNLMKKWTGLMYSLGIATDIMRKPGGVYKPFNKFVTRNFFIKLSEELDLLTTTDNLIELREFGKAIAKDFTKTLYTRGYDLIRTMPGEYTIYSAIADSLLYAKVAYIVSPWINGTLVEVVHRVLEINRGIEELYLVMRKTHDNTAYARKLHEIMGGALKILYFNRLHAKISADPEGSAVISSANMTKTSLASNYEVGIYYIKTPIELQTAVDELLAISKPYRVF